MTYLRSVPSHFDNVFRSPLYERPARPAEPGVSGQLAEAVFAAALGLLSTVLRAWRQSVETRRARQHLMQLDDHLLRDIGLARTDIHFGDFETLGRHRRAGRVR
ncbi:MAG: DUF1127 domain-containing protein [Alphaproteobacteria bacterium]|nr:DUF1127 domain-containing protein [Alphaproteobacteria bacterium]MBV8410929.1 DUF1127 domain-containing protein [Alphaproteobacteria bacterium]